MIKLHNNLFLFTSVCNMNITSNITSQYAVLKLKFPPNLNQEWIDSVRYNFLRKVGNAIGTEIVQFYNQSSIELDYDNLTIITDWFNNEYTVYIIDNTSVIEDN